MGAMGCVIAQARKGAGAAARGGSGRLRWGRLWPSSHGGAATGGRQPSRQAAKTYATLGTLVHTSFSFDSFYTRPIRRLLIKYRIPQINTF